MGAITNATYDKVIVWELVDKFGPFVLTMLKGSTWPYLSSLA